MTIFSDRAIRQGFIDGMLRVEGMNAGSPIQPASLDVTLGEQLLGYDMDNPVGVIDPRDPPPLVSVDWYVDEDDERQVKIFSQEFMLGSIGERVTLGSDVAVEVVGKSSLARLGLFVHLCAGYVDPGWDGEITLELFNAAPLPIILRPGMPIAQLVVHSLSTTPQRLYGDASLGSHYQGSLGPVSARYGPLSGREPDRNAAPLTDALQLAMQRRT